jgi:hypothetical protein
MQSWASSHNNLPLPLLLERGKKLIAYPHPGFSGWGFYKRIVNNHCGLLIIIPTDNLVLLNKLLKMKKIVFAFLCMVTISAQAQTVEEIITKYATAMGGLEAFNKVTTAKLTGTATLQGNDFSFTTQIVNGKGMRTDVDVMGQAVVNAYGNGKGWKINPFAGAETPTEVSGAELEAFKAQASLANALMDYASRGHKVELAGQEGTTWKIKLINKETGKDSYYFINTTDFLLAKSISKRELNGTEMEVETAYSNFKEFGGIKFAMSAIQSVGGNTMQELNFSNVELNVKIDETIFNQ